MSREIESVEALLAALPHGLDGAVVQGLDLEAVADRLSSASGRGAVFLGCRLGAAEAPLLASGALCFPRLPDLPFSPYRPALYRPEELMAGYRRGAPESLAATFDQRVYAHYAAHRSHPPVLLALAERLHDHAIDDALGDFLAEGPKRVVAIMGGHAMRRDEPAYRAVAEMGRGLARRGFLVATGGGPGAMEAAQLGALVAHGEDSALDGALGILSGAPKYTHPEWVETALRVRDRFAEHSAPSLGIPTWFYGHEPPNLFGTHVAKYFSNSLREDGLLAIAHHGVIYAPGSAGTIQEVFMDAAQNHYATFGTVSPMVFYGTRYWTEEKPVYPLLRQLARGHRYGDLLGIEDEPAAIVDFIVRHPPVPK